MNITEKVAYIKGLADGLGIDDATKEGKILAAIIDVLDDIATEIDDVEEVVADMADQIDAVDEDLASVEELIYEDEDDCDCCDCDCDDEDVFEVECPSCNDVIYLDADMLEEGGITCPNCGENLEFDFDCCDDDCCCCGEEASEE